MDTKRCPKCGETKPVSEFCKDASRKDGLGANCKVCKRAWDKQWYEANPEKVRAKCTRRRGANPDLARARRARWRRAHPEKERARDARYSQEVTPAYAARQLRIPAADLTPELYAAYREQLLNKRALRELQQTLKGLNNDQRREPEPDGNCHLPGLQHGDHG